jgi:hypothetical protein
VPWQTPYERVRCCLRCCLLHWVGALGLRDNFDRNKIPGARPDEMLLGFGLESTMGFAALRKPLDATGGADGLNRADLWAPEVAAPGGVAVFQPSSWVDVAFGDGCGGFAGYSFGTARRRHLEQLVEILDGRTLALVSTDDCDAPDSPAADRVLRHPNLAAWFVSGQHKRAKFPTSKAHISAIFHSFRLIFGRAIISRNGLEAWVLFPKRARAEHSP